jgi:EAL domain-containing protein (putative c-di-GMP-specific phosphodiesterase class I)
MIINRLKALGVLIYMDDFGKGYSSLGYLNQLPIDGIKIDRTFINQLKRHNLQRIIECVVSMGRDIGVRVIAEGVESSDQRDYLVEVGCDYGQGFIFSEALDTEKFESFLKTNS